MADPAGPADGGDDTDPLVTNLAVYQTEMILIHLWLILLGLLTVGMSVSCLKYCATNRDARYNYISTCIL